MTAGEYVSSKAWENATPPTGVKLECGQECCKLIGHGTYERKIPVAFKVPRFICPDCNRTVSLLPDFAASRRPGFLQDHEDEAAACAKIGSSEAARQLRPHDPAYARWNKSVSLKSLGRAVMGIVSIAFLLHPELLRGCPCDLLSVRERLSTQSLLLDMRRQTSITLFDVPSPVGFLRPAYLENRKTGPPHSIIKD